MDYNSGNFMDEPHYNGRKPLLDVVFMGDNSIKLDIETTLEAVLKNVRIIFILLAIIPGIGLLAVYFTDGKITPVALSLFATFSIISIFFAILSKTVDNFYLVDLSKKTMFYRFKFLFIERFTPCLQFSDIQAVTIISRETGSAMGRRGMSFRREYQCVFLSKDGKQIRVSDWKSSRGRNSLFRIANFQEECEQLAHRLQLKFIPFEEEKIKPPTEMNLLR